MKLNKTGTGLIIAGSLTAVLGVIVGIIGEPQYPLTQSSVGTQDFSEVAGERVLGDQVVSSGVNPVRSADSRIVLRAAADQVAEVKKVGAGWLYLADEDVVLWGEVEQTTGQYDWSRLDAMVQDAQEHGFHLLVPILPFAVQDQSSCYPLEEAPGRVAFQTPCNPDALELFLETFHDRYSAQAGVSDTQLVLPYLRSEAQTNNASYTYTGTREAWNAILTMIDDVWADSPVSPAEPRNWQIFTSEELPDSGTANENSTEILQAISSAFLNGAEKLIVEIPRPENEEYQMLVSSLRSFVQTADRFVKVQSAGENAVLFTLPKDLRRWILSGDNDSQNAFLQTLQGKIRITSLNGSQQIREAAEYRSQGEGVLIVEPIDNVQASDEKETAPHAQIQHLSLAALVQGRPSEEKTSFTLEDDLVLVVRLHPQSPPSVQAIFSLVLNDGGIIVPESQIELLDGEIAIPKPSQPGTYVLKLQVSQTEEYQLSFDLRK